MAKRAYSPKEVMKRTYKTLPWGEKWSGPFGHPEMTETWFISGASASGKSSFVMQLAKELCKYGRVLYESLEEGLNQSFKERVELFKMGEEQGRFRIAMDSTMAELEERLRRPKGPQFVIIDSYQMTYWDYPETIELINRHPRKCFIFISQEDKSQPTGKGARRLRYISGVKVRVMGYKAYCQGRFTEDPGSYYPVWEEGILRTTNDLT